MSLRSPPASSRLLRLLPKIGNHDPAEMTLGGRRVAPLSGPWGSMSGGSGLRGPGRPVIREKHPGTRSTTEGGEAGASKPNWEGFAYIGGRKRGLSESSSDQMQQAGTL